MASTVLKIGGMSCQGCVKNVTAVLLGISGVSAATVSLENAEAVVEFDESRVQRQALQAAVDDAGFEAS